MNTNILDRLDAIHAFLWRWRWPVRLVLAVVLAVWLGPWAHRRMTTPPADPTALARIGMLPKPATPLADDDPLKALMDAMEALVTYPTLTGPPPAPPGQQWRVVDEYASSLQASLQAGGSGAQVAQTWLMDPIDAYAGEWTPATRYHLQRIIAYMEDPRVIAALDKVRTAARQPVAGQPADRPLGVTLRFGSLIRQVGKLLCAHARYEMAERRDVEAACRDIEAILDLADRMEHGGGLMEYLVGIALQYYAAGEVISWSMEFDLSRDQVRRVQATIDRMHVEMPQRWRAMVEGEMAGQFQILDGLFTKETDGGGWLVLHTPQTSEWGDRALTVFNLLSVVVNDRKAVAAKLNLIKETMSRVGDLPYAQGREVLVKRSLRGSWLLRGNPADGLIWMLAENDMYPNALPQFVNNMLRKRAVQTWVGISQYKATHGHYPAGLRDLVPDYLAEVPIDPFDDQPLRYRLDERDGCVVYSVGEDGVDDGGPTRDDKGERLRSFNGKDYVFTGWREEPELEWYLEPAPVAVPSGSATQEGADRDE